MPNKDGQGHGGGGAEESTFETAVLVEWVGRDVKCPGFWSPWGGWTQQLGYAWANQVP